MARRDREQPVVALRFDVDAAAEDLARFCDGEAVVVDGCECIRVPTETGIALAHHDDWIVRLGDGKFLAVTSDEFAARFEPLPSEIPT